MEHLGTGPGMILHLSIYPSTKAQPGGKMLLAALKGDSQAQDIIAPTYLGRVSLEWCVCVCRGKWEPWWK